MEPKAIASSLSTIERQYKDMLNNKIMREREKNKQKNSKIKKNMLSMYWSVRCCEVSNYNSCKRKEPSAATQKT